MGASSSKIEEDKALRLCRERKKFIRQALDGRCSLAATHVAYIQSLRIAGTALRKFFEPEAPRESSLYTSTSATPEPVALTEKSLSQFSLSSPSFSQRVDAAENSSPPPSPPTSTRHHTNYMKFRGSNSKMVEEKPAVPIAELVTSSAPPRDTVPSSVERHATSSTFDAPSVQAGTPPWDYFGLLHPIDNHSSPQEGRGSNQGLKNADYMRRLGEEEGIPELEDEASVSSSATEQSQESEDEFDDEPSVDTLVRSFENVNRAADNYAATATPGMPSVEREASDTDFLNGEKSNSPDLSPLRATSSRFPLPNDVKTTPAKDNGHQSKAAHKDFLTIMKDIEFLFVKASDSGREVPRMLEANKFHFRPIFAPIERGSLTLSLLRNCFSCGEDPSQVQEGPAQTSTKYLTWHRTASSRSSSSRNPLGANSKDDIEDLTGDLFENLYMNSGSHASTLDRFYAWEKKLYDEVKASEMVRKEYDQKCKLLRQLESEGRSFHSIDKTRAVVKDLHSRISVAIHRIDSISKKIEDLRDTELQPQLEELIEGLRKMWEVMFECHKHQFQIVSVAYIHRNPKISLQSDMHRQIIVHLENELSSLSSTFTKWIAAQNTYVEDINGWLNRCVSLQQKHTKRKRRVPPPPLRDYGPPIYVTCGVWLDKLVTLPTKEVADSIKGLTAELTHFLPRQDKSQGKGVNSDLGVNLLRDEASEEWISGFDRFRSSLVSFLAHLSNFAGSSVTMFTELQKSIEEAKIRYAQTMSQS